MADAGLIGTKARQRKQRRSAELQGAFVTDEQQRLLEIEDMRLVVKFGDKKRYTRNSSRQGSMTNQGATRTPSKRFSRNSTLPTRRSQQGVISAADPSTAL